MEKRWQKLQRNIFIVFLLAVLSSLILYYLLADEFSLSEIKFTVKEFGIWAPLIFILIYMVGTIFIPSTPFMALAGILFGFKYGLLYTIIGGLLSSIIVFYISRRLGKDWAESMLQHKYLKKVQGYNEKLNQRGIVDLIVLRIIPIMPFNVLNILMGVSKIKISDYVLGTILGLIPSNLVAVYLGTFIAKIF